jgi:uncharacterized protein
VRPTTSLLALGDERFVSLATFRRSGEEVATPVWIAREGTALVVTTGADTGKVTRLRHDPRARLRPCDRRGRVAADAPVAEATAEVLEDPADQRAALGLLARKYGVEYRLISLVERIFRRGRTRRVILRLAAADPV